MKKVIILLLVLVVVLSTAGCSSQTSKQTSAEESKVEQKTDNTQKIDEEAKKEEKVKENKEHVENAHLLKGKIINYGIPMGIGILLDEKMDIDGREVEKVFFDEDIITNLIPRKYMTYYFEGGTSLKEEFNSQIGIKVKIDPKSYDYYSDLDRTSAKIIEVVSLDGESNPRDKTEDEYSLDYYKSVFYTLTIKSEFPYTDDVKEFYLYKNTDDPIIGDMFKTAVDKILERGLFIQLIDGEYEINEIEKKNIKDTVVLNGKLVWCYFYKGIGIELDEKQEILGKEVEAVYFGEDIIKDLIPRKYMTFLSQAGTYLEEDFNKQLDLQVKINPNSYSYDSDFDVTFVDLIEVISLDGEINPRDKTKDEYPIDYWKAVFYALIRDVELIPTEDIKNFYLYNAEEDFGRSGMFRTAVDKILEAGLYIQLIEGKYEINETKKEYIKGDMDSPTIFNMEDLDNGDAVSEGIIIDNINYTKGSDAVSFDLKGEVLVGGTITYDSEFWGAYVVNVEDTYLFNTEIKVTLADTYTFNYKPEFMVIRNEEIIPEEHRQALKEGKKLCGKINIKDISFSARYQSEDGESCELTDLSQVNLVD